MSTFPRFPKTRNWGDPCLGAAEVEGLLVHTGKLYSRGRNTTRYGVQGGRQNKGGVTRYRLYGLDFRSTYFPRFPSPASKVSCCCRHNTSSAASRNLPEDDGVPILLISLYYSTTDQNGDSVREYYFVLLSHISPATACHAALARQCVLTRHWD